MAPAEKPSVTVRKRGLGSQVMSPMRLPTIVDRPARSDIKSAKPMFDCILKLLSIDVVISGDY